MICCRPRRLPGTWKSGPVSCPAPLLLPFVLAQVLGFFNDMTPQGAIGLRSFGARAQVDRRIEREEFEEIAVSSAGRAGASKPKFAEVVCPAGGRARRPIT